MTWKYTDAMLKEIAFNFTNVTVGNKTASYLEFCKNNNMAPVPADKQEAFQIFKKEKTKQFVHEFEEENRKSYESMRDRCIEAVSSIAFDPAASKKDRLTALKELNIMFGFNQTNVNVQNENLEIVIKGE